MITWPASSSGCAARTRAATPATIGAAALVPFHSTTAPSDVTPNDVFTGRGDADGDPLRRGLFAGNTVLVHTCHGEHTRDRRRRTDNISTAPSIPRSGHDDNIVVVGV